MPIPHQPEECLAEGGTAKINVNPSQLPEEMGRPLERIVNNTYQVHDPHGVLERLRPAVLVVARRLRLEGDDAGLVHVHGQVAAAPGVGVAGAELVALRPDDVKPLAGALVAAETLHSVLDSGVEVPGFGAKVQASEEEITNLMYCSTCYCIKYLAGVFL